MLRIYPVELAAEFETRSRLPTDEYTPPDTTQLDFNVFSFRFFCQIRRGSRRSLIANSTRQLSRVGVGNMYCAMCIEAYWTLQFHFSVKRVKHGKNPALTEQGTAKQ